MARALSADPAIFIVGTAVNGAIAITMARELQPDVIILDLEMPVMDGMTALPQLLKASAHCKIIIASTLSLRNADISLKALSLGASDYLAKPSSKGTNETEQFYRDLISKVKVFGSTKKISVPNEKRMVAPPVVIPAPASAAAAPVALPPGAALNPDGVRALAIASSTGGPQALMQLFVQLRGRLKGIPIFITQHMPPTFTTILAEHISREGERQCYEATDGMKVQPGCAYLARGDYHMVAEKDGEAVTIRINQDPQENFCRPSADPMLRSLSNIYGKNLAVAVLTGMGQDGMEGCKVVVKEGGNVIAQDEATCVVYGMPKAVIENKLAKAVLPLPDMGGFLIRQVEGGR